MDHARKLKFSSYVHLPSINKNVSISLCLSDSVQCRRRYFFRAFGIYFSFGNCYDVNIKQLCYAVTQHVLTQFINMVTLE